jgi:hypothetical protein
MAEDSAEILRAQDELPRHTRLGFLFLMRPWEGPQTQDTIDFPFKSDLSRNRRCKVVLHIDGNGVNQALGAVVSEEHLTCAAMHRTVPQVIFNGSQSK